MGRIKLDKDILPLSEFRLKTALYFDRLKKTKRPLIITQNGKSTAVLLEISEYEVMVDKLEILEDIKTADEQISKELEIAHNTLKKKFTKGIK